MSSNSVSLACNKINILIILRTVFHRSYFQSKKFSVKYCCRVTDPDFKGALTKASSLWRRYTEFELLRAYLEISYPYIVLPPLPEKKVLYAWQKVTTDTFDPDFVDRRRAGLEVQPYLHIYLSTYLSAFYLKIR